MKKLSKLFCLSILTFSLVFSLAGCGGAETPKGNNADTKKAEGTGPAKPAEDKPKDDAKTDMAATGDDIGIPECDNYIKKYEACVKDKVPAQASEALKTSFETVRKGWKDAAKNPQAKEGLASACKQAHEAAKQSMAAYKCDW